MTSRKYFGTDGIRGTVGQGPINPEFILKLGWATGKVLAKGSGSLVVIGKDTRISGYMFESALESGLAAAGVGSLLLGPMPTPAIAYLTQTLRAKAGIVISASHNAYPDNGIKFFSGDGTKLPDEVEAEIERYIDMPMETVPSEKLGRAKRIVDAGGRYIEFCKATVPNNMRLSGLKIVVDCAQGATYHVAPSVFRELDADIIEIASSPNGLNINLDCGATKPQALSTSVIENEADLGIAFDGDGDRLIMVDNKGEVVDGDEILFIIARDYLRHGRLQGGVVGTQMSNLGLELALKTLGIGFARSKVGDRYVMSKLQEKGWVLGGESSGHIICLDKTTTGDGIVSSLQVLAAMIHSGLSLHELKKGMEKLPQTMINVAINPDADRQALMANEDVSKAVSLSEEDMAGEGRVLLRPSGTEPLIRVMVEGKNIDKVNQHAEAIAEVVKAQC